jgi:tripartite-type tricarboxylate transporter receptor subunit TctC
MKRRRLLGIAAASASPWAALPAWGQDFPSKPLRLIVPFPPGGTTDIAARALVDALAKEVGQPIVVDNKGGAGGSVGTRELARAEPDGHTIGLMSVSTHGTNPAVHKNLPYDVIRDFTPITKLLSFPGVIAVNPRFPARTLADFLRVLKSAPGRYSYASSGNGGATHLAMELFKLRTGVFITHIPYRGSGPALNDVIAGQVEILWDALPSALPYIKSGQLVPIGLAAAQRSAQLPDLATFTELGVKDYEPDLWNGLLAPAGLPTARLAVLYDSVRRAAARPEVKRRFDDLGATLALNGPQALYSQIRTDVETWRRVARFANVTAD